MAIRDLREYIERLEQYGELQRITAEVDWNLEAGAITRRAIELGAPAPLMTRIKGYPEGYGLLGAPVAGSKVKGNKSWRRMAIALEMDPDCTYWDVVEEVSQRIRHPLKPVFVSDGPCKENIKIGKDVNLFEFPIPMQHDGDGGRYLSFHMIIFKDPDTDWVNWSMYRVMIQTRNKFGGHLLPFQHGGYIYYNKYESRDKPMPFCIVVGGEPLNTVVGALGVPFGVNEVDIAGGLRREPAELIRAETVDLYVPATAEVVFEGEIYPHERWEEGPYAEYHGYMAGPRLPAPVYRVKCITHRTNPIMPFCCTGTPIDDCAAINSIDYPGELMRVMKEERGWPVRRVAVPGGSICNTVVVSVKPPYPNFAKHVADELAATKAGAINPKIIVVDEDVDPSNVEEVFHAMATRLHPGRGIHTTEYAPGHSVAAFYSLRERQFGLGAQAWLDCTWPKDWPSDSIPKETSFGNSYSQDTQDMVLKRWMTHYGYAKEDYRVR